MYDPDAYVRGNTLQIQGAKEFLSENIHLIKWKKTGEVVMDIGCGPGYTTWKILKMFIPDSCETIYAIDCQERMLEFGRMNYPAINFINLDIRSYEFPIQFNNSVDHMFSFFCFHWIADQSLLMKNLFNTLKPGGDVLATFPGSSAVYNLYKRMAKMSKWKKYENILQFGIDYDLLSEESYRKMLLATGFDILMIKWKDNPCFFDTLQEFTDFLVGINPLPNDPPNLKEDFIFDAIMELKKMGIVNKNNSQVILPQKYMSFCVRKPELEINSVSL